MKLGEYNSELLIRLIYTIIRITNDDYPLDKDLTPGLFCGGKKFLTADGRGQVPDDVSGQTQSG